jgi:hypothetical protein
VIYVCVESALDEESRWKSNRWHRVTLGLLSGLVAAGFMFFLMAAIQTPGLDPPPESAALFIVVTTAGVISYYLLRCEDSIGYPAAIVTGGFVFVILALVATGTYGSIGPRTNPAGPISYTALAVAVIITAGVAWRKVAVTEA